MAFFVAALVLAGGLAAYVVRQQDQAFRAADWVAHTIDIRARLQQLLAAIEDGPGHAPRALTMAAALRESVADHPQLHARLETVAQDIESGRERVRATVEELIGDESRFLLQRREAHEREAQQARFALGAGSVLVMLLLGGAFALVVRDNRQRRAAEEELRRSNESLERRVAERTEEQRQAEARMRELSRRLLNVQEEERRALARELHDEVGQQLGAIKLNLKALAAAGGDATRIGDGLAIVDATIGHIRDRALELRPALLDDLGLAAALEWLCRQQAQRSGLEVAFQGAPLPDLSSDLATAAYRIAQEGISNALKHAAATGIRVSLHAGDRRLEVEVTDNGCGFDPATAAPGIGLPGMRERASSLGGSLHLDSAPGQGTRLFARFP